MEPVGLTFGVVGLTGQLAKTAMDCYKIFDDMSDVGTIYGSILHKLRTEGLRLKRWEEALGLGGDFSQQRLDPEDYWYQYATATLARIVTAFASVGKLQAKYGVVVKQANTVRSLEEPKPRWNNRLSMSLPFRSRSRSPSKSPFRNANTQLVTSCINENDLHPLENPRVLVNRKLLPGLPGGVSAVTEAMDRVNQSLPMYRKLSWAVADKAKLDDLLGILASLSGGPSQVPPANHKFRH